MLFFRLFVFFRRWIKMSDVSIKLVYVLFQLSIQPFHIKIIAMYLCDGLRKLSIREFNSKNFENHKPYILNVSQRIIIVACIYKEKQILLKCLGHRLMMCWWNRLTDGRGDSRFQGWGHGHCGWFRGRQGCCCCN